VHVTHFSPHLPQLLSASDDTTVKLYDLSTQACISTLSSHTDYVRSALFHPTDPNLLLSASYDTTFRVHDVRLPESSANVMTMRHGDSPIEDILAFPSGGVAVSVGGPILRVWDMAMGKCIRALSNHQKTVTSVTFDGTKGRVLTGGLDMMVKVYDVEDWKVVHTMRYPAPILSLAVSVSPRCFMPTRFSRFFVASLLPARLPRPHTHPHSRLHDPALHDITHLAESHASNSPSHANPANPRSPTTPTSPQA
jgi:U3 small nucleolar RNA-associated protein 15